MKQIILTFGVLLASFSVNAQVIDKAEKDQLIYKELTAGYAIVNWHPDMVVAGHMIRETEEEGVYLVKGDSFQVKSICSDYYVCKKDDQWVPLYDFRYPMETVVNLLLNRIENNRHQLSVRHHQYGGGKPVINIPMQYLYDLLARNMNLYCSVTYIGADDIKAVLVLHQKRQDFIHMLDLKIPTKDLFDEEGVVTGELYTNIPQDNLKSIFRERRK